LYYIIAPPLGLGLSLQLCARCSSAHVCRGPWTSNENKYCAMHESHEYYYYNYEY